MDDVIAVVTDLFFQSRILAAARAAGRTVRFVSALDRLDGSRSHGLALVDLDAEADVLGLIGVLSQSIDGPVVAFGPHVDTERRKAARAAGADRVMAKSKFVSELPQLMVRETRGPAE